MTLCSSGGEQIKGGGAALGKHLGREGTRYLSGRLSHWESSLVLGPRDQVTHQKLQHENGGDANSHTRAVWSATNIAHTMHRCLIPALLSDKGKLKAYDAPPHSSHIHNTHTLLCSTTTILHSPSPQKHSSFITED